MADGRMKAKILRGSVDIIRPQEDDLPWRPLFVALLNNLFDVHNRCVTVGCSNVANLFFLLGVCSVPDLDTYSQCFPTEFC